MATMQTGRSQLAATAMHVRAAGALGGRTLRLCIHQSEATHRLLAQQGIPSTVQLGAARLVIGRDRISPLEMVYDPREVHGEWHAWVRVGQWVVDASVADLHEQLVVTGQADAASYHRIKPFAADVLVAQPRKIKPSRYVPLPDVLAGLYDEFLSSPADMSTVAQMVGRQA